MNLLDLLKSLMAGIKWPAVKLTDLTTVSIQELALIAVALLLLYEGSALIRLICAVALVVVGVTLAYRFVESKLKK